MKALTRIVVNPTSKNLEKSDADMSASARKLRALGRTAVLMRIDRINPLFLGASNSLCTEERMHLTNKAQTSLDEIFAKLKRGAEMPPKDNQSQI